MKKPRLTIHETAQATGIPESSLRMWEKRYGWPNPPRNDSGYREYPAHMIPELIRVRTLHETGTSLMDLIKDGLPCFPVALIEKPSKPQYDFSAVPQPVTPHAQKIRQDLEQAIKDGREGAIQAILAQKELLRPSERECAILAVLRAAGR